MKVSTPIFGFFTTSRSRALALVAVTGLLATTNHGMATDYFGATAALARAAELAGAEPVAVAPEETVAKKLSADLAAFKLSAQGRAVVDSTSGWLALAERVMKLKPEDMGESYRGGQRGPVDELFGALPGPAAWPELIAAIGQRPALTGESAAPELGIKLIAAALSGDAGAQRRVVDDLEEALKSAKRNEGFAIGSVAIALNQYLAGRSDDIEEVLTLLERQLRRYEGGRGAQQFPMPDLVTLAGADRAEQFIRNVLTNQSVEVRVTTGVETERLARRLALELVNELKTPQWPLAASLEGVELYEALQKKFAMAKPAAEADPLERFSRMSGASGSQRQAQIYYLLALITKGRVEEAVKLARDPTQVSEMYLPDEVIRQLEAAGHAEALFGFFKNLLVDNAELPFWDDLVKVGARAGRSEEVIGLLEASLAKQDLPSPLKKSLREQYVNALLAADRVDEAVKEIQAQLAGSQAPGDSPGELAIKTARLGRILNRPELIETGIAAVRAHLVKAGPREFDYSANTIQAGLAELLGELGRGPEAEQVWLEALAAQIRKQQADGNDYGGGGDEMASALTGLAHVYSAAGRHADVVALLDEADGWGAKDLFDVLATQTGGYFDGHHGKGAATLGSLAARALVALGRHDQARPIIHALLDEQPGNDRGYELLLELKGENVVAKLDELFQRDPFEERPLIWKASVLDSQGEPAAAEKLLRQAIAIDPSDGEQGPGDRMRVYAVLAEIRAARGDADEANILRGAVKAIRLSEAADNVSEAGLLQRALKMYEESLTHFADAYCIQSRLALQFSELGLHKEAEAHYQRAYELMPGSFGRVESHCFGCEGAFKGARAQSVAERVFTKLAVEQPNKPQVHYLLGYLRREQGRWLDALPAFRRAVELDPDYLNAWKELHGAASSVKLPAAELDRINLNLVRLDPLQRHGGFNLSSVSDLRALWEAVERNASIRPPRRVAFYPLKASAAKLGKSAKGNSRERQWFDDMRNRTNGGTGSDEATDPALMISRTILMNQARALIGKSGSSYREY